MIMHMMAGGVVGRSNGCTKRAILKASVAADAIIPVRHGAFFLRLFRLLASKNYKDTYMKLLFTL